jgi:hypothetical protein
MARSISISDFRESEARLNETGALLGELAAMLSDVADCMTLSPARFHECVSASEWPSFDRLQGIVATWADRREEVRLVWRALSEEDRQAVGPLPDFDSDRPSV